MQDYEFNTDMRKVKACFPSALNDEKIRIIYDKVRHVDGNTFSRLVDKLIMNAKHAPTVADFVELVRSSSLERQHFELSPGEPSMFTEKQTKFLFNLTRHIATDRIPDSQEFTKLFGNALTAIVFSKDKERAHNLFKEVSETYGIEY